jgi:hypothetical protein
VSHAAGHGGVGDENLDEVLELTFGLGDVVAAMDQGCELGPMMATGFVEVESMGCKDRLESLGRSGGSVPDLGEVFDMGIDVTLMPGVEDCLHIGEVFVEGGAADAGLLG